MPSFEVLPTISRGKSDSIDLRSISLRLVKFHLRVNKITVSPWAGFRLSPSVTRIFTDLTTPPVQWNPGAKKPIHTSASTDATTPNQPKRRRGSIGDLSAIRAAIQGARNIKTTKTIAIRAAMVINGILGQTEFCHLPSPEPRLHAKAVHGPSPPERSTIPLERRT